MRAIRPVSFLFLLLLLSGPVLLSENVFAMCCGCTTCRTTPWCSCPGQNGCAWYQCRSADADNLQAYNPTDNNSVIAKVARKLDDLVYVRQVSECSRAKLALRLLGDTAENIKIDPFGADLAGWYGGALEVKLAANRDR